MFQLNEMRFQFTHDFEIYNSQDDQKREMQVRINESQNIVRCQTMTMLMPVMMTMNVKTAVRVKARTKSALQYIDNSYSINIELLSILHCTEKKT